MFSAWGFPPLITLTITILVGVVLGLIVGFISLRIEGMYLALLRLGIAEMLTVPFKNATGFYWRRERIKYLYDQHQNVFGS